VSDDDEIGVFVEDWCNLVLETVNPQSAGLESLSRCCMDILQLFTELRGYTINIICQQDAMRKRYPVVTRLSLYQIGARTDHLLTGGFLHKINLLFSYTKNSGYNEYAIERTSAMHPCLIFNTGRTPTPLSEGRLPPFVAQLRRACSGQCKRLRHNYTHCGAPPGEEGWV
jgi:hypothetical protein